VATVSTAIGYCKGIERIRKYAKLAFIPGTFLAITIHMMYNLSALADSFVFANKSIPFFIFNPMLIILLATLFFLVLVFATIDEKRRKEAAKREIMVPK
jgi:RsiW-degrading membrane proteinase PrsW (M82 family)